MKVQIFWTQITSFSDKTSDQSVSLCVTEISTDIAVKIPISGNFHATHELIHHCSSLLKRRCRYQLNW